MRSALLSLTLTLLPLQACRAVDAQPTQPGHDLRWPGDGPAGEGEPLQVGFLIFRGFYQTELTAPYDVLQHTIFHADPGLRVFTVAPTLEPVTSFEGIRYLPHYDFARHPQVDVLVVPSGEGSMSDDLEDPVLTEWLGRVGQDAELLMSLCDGAFLLANAGLLDGLESTTYPGDIEAYQACFPKLIVHEDLSFVHHGRAITSAGGAQSFDAALYLVELLFGGDAAAGVARGMVIDWNVDDVPHVVVE